MTAPRAEATEKVPTHCRGCGRKLSAVATTGYCSIYCLIDYHDEDFRDDQL